MPVERASNSQPNWALRIAFSLSALYVYSAFLPFEIHPDNWQLERVLAYLLRPPFADRPPGTWGLTFSLSNCIVNASAGFLLGWFAYLGFRRLLGRVLAFPAAVVLGFVTALAMEAIQVGVEGRVPTPTDICTITAGAALGAIAAVLLGRGILLACDNRLLRPLLRSRRGLAFALLVVFLLVRSLFPTSVSANFGELLDNAKRANILPFYRPGIHLAVQLRALGFDINDRPYRKERFWQELTPVRYGFNLAGHALLYGAIAVALASVLKGNLFRDTMLCILIVGGLGTSVELLQLFLPSQCADINVALIATAAGATGPTLWRPLEGRPVATATAAVVAGILYLATQYLKPGLTVSSSGISFWDLVPIYHMERSSGRVGLLMNVFECFAPFVFLGWAVMELASHRWGSRRSVLLAIAFCAAVAAVLEAAQGRIGRVPSIDGVFLAAVGGACGAWLGLHAARSSDEPLLTDSPPGAYPKPLSSV